MGGKRLLVLLVLLKIRDGGPSESVGGASALVVVALTRESVLEAAVGTGVAAINLYQISTQVLYIRYILLNYTTRSTPFLPWTLSPARSASPAILKDTPCSVLSKPIKYSFYFCLPFLVIVTCMHFVFNID